MTASQASRKFQYSVSTATTHLRADSFQGDEALDMDFEEMEVFFLDLALSVQSSVNMSDCIRQWAKKVRSFKWGFLIPSSHSVDKKCGDITNYGTSLVSLKNGWNSAFIYDIHFIHTAEYSSVSFQCRVHIKSTVQSACCIFPRL